MLADYDYELPPERIAQVPAQPRDASRLLVSRPEGVTDAIFADIRRWLQPGDLLILNDARVIPARLLGRKPTGGRVEILLLNPAGEAGLWEALVGANKPARPGMRVEIAPGLAAEVVARREEKAVVRLLADGDIDAAIERHGQMPLPPYIGSAGPELDRARYQTVFARQPGAVAAPTAGLHFSEALLAELARIGVESAVVTLLVGLGTFQPIREVDPDKHVMHVEQRRLSAETAARINAARAEGRRVIAVGTTAVRTLESAWDPERGGARPVDGPTDLFIRPGFRFRLTDAMITNFHLPRSTLLMLVAAFVGLERMRRDYRHAVANGYRFYSYGDANLLFPDPQSDSQTSPKSHSGHRTVS